MLKRKPELLQTDIAKLGTFGQCHLRGQLESAQLTEESRQPAADANKAEQERRRHYQNIVAALDRGFALAGPGVSVGDRIDARFLLIYYLLLTGDSYRAAVLGDDLARTYP